MKYNDTYDMQLLPRDTWLDEIRLCSLSGPLLRLMTVYRYKTSGLSGDEWRTSTQWQCTAEIAARLQGDLGTTRDPAWLAFDGPYGTLDAGGAALYPGLFRSQKMLHQIPCSSIDFFRKGRLLYRSTYDEQPMPLIVSAGHLPWAMVMARDEPLGTIDAWEDMRQLCFQMGCAAPASSTYVLKHLFADDGARRPATASSSRGENPAPVQLVRRFCPLHLRRGDCGLEDADDNYTVIDGPGPGQAQGWREYESRASLHVI